MLFNVPVIIAFIADLLLGDPRWFPHPVRLIGWVCQKTESLLRRLQGLSDTLLGWLAFMVILAVTLAFVLLILFSVKLIDPFYSDCVATIIIYFCLAAGDLKKHSTHVYIKLTEGSLAGARKAVSLMVGRDTRTLDRSQVSRACLESVSENLVDGVTSPLFWAYIFSMLAHFSSGDEILWAAVGACLYKAVNTMDSMWGYKNPTYVNFGTAAARVDDAANFFPARLSAFCTIAAAALTGYDVRSATRVFFQDRLASSSPNSGQTEAAFAGALNVELGGPSIYFGEMLEKPTIGEGLKQPQPEDIPRGNRLMLLTSAIFIIFITLVHALWALLLS